MAEKSQSVALYDLYFLLWKSMGIKDGNHSVLWWSYDILINIFVTIAYPTHLFIGLLFNPSLGDVFTNITITVTCIGCSLKHYNYRYNWKKIRRLMTLLSQLDQRVGLCEEERELFHKVIKVETKRVANAFLYVGMGTNALAIIAVLLSSERRLLYPGWFPFDWTSSAAVYWFALLYQIIGVTIQINQNIANDIFPPASLCLVSGHVRLLGMRVGRIGNDEVTTESKEENNKELIHCIEDHKIVVEILRILQDTLYYPQFTQFLSTGINICVTVVYLLFYVDNIFAAFYYVAFLVAMGIELLPCCYYGSILQIELFALPYATFKSNWILQGKEYRRNLIIFTQLTLQEFKIMAAFININLNAFFNTVKMAYSLYAILTKTKS